MTTENKDKLRTVRENLMLEWQQHAEMLAHDVIVWAEKRSPQFEAAILFRAGQMLQLRTIMRCPHHYFEKEDSKP